MPRRRRLPSRLSDDYDNLKDQSFQTNNRSRKIPRKDAFDRNPNPTNDASSTNKVDWLVYILSVCFLASAFYTYCSSFIDEPFHLVQIMSSKRNFQGFTHVGKANLLRGASYVPRLPSYAQEPNQDLNPWDAYGIHQMLQEVLKEKRKSHQEEDDSSIASLSSAMEVISELLSQFSARYGGDTAARAILQKALTNFYEDEFESPGGESMQIPRGLLNTAERFINAQKEDRPFRMAFAGYSVTVG